MAAPEFPIFDADHHLYDTQDAFTRHLPKDLAHLFRYVQVDGRTKVVIGGFLSDYIPSPTFDVVARPGAWMDYVSGRNPEGLPDPVADASELAHRTDDEIQRIMGADLFDLVGVRAPA